jgi:hypothetical protein
MNAWYPPWVKEWEENVPSWTVQKRHLWMSEALRYRRKLQAVNYGRNELEHYSTLLSEFFEHSALSEGDTFVLEILSDGLGDIEPVWHGIKVETGGIGDIPQWMHQEFIQRISERRNRHNDLLKFKTHLEIGQKLLEPSLFKVTTTKVEYYDKDQWHDLNEPDSPLPLKLAIEEGININWEDILSIKQALPALFKGDDYKKTVEDIRKSLASISRDVLWPALFHDRGHKGDWLSLILIQASTWQVPGVWALHAFSKKGKTSDKINPKSNLLLSTINPPVLCLNDALGAMFIRDSTHRQRQYDLRLYRKCKGITSQLPPDKEFYDSTEDDLEIYDRDLSADPFKRYGHIYNAVCEKYMAEDSETPPSESLSDPSLLLLNRLLRQTFVAFATQPQEPTVSMFVLKDAVMQCLLVIDECNPSDLRSAGQILVSQHKENAVITDARGWLNSLDFKPQNGPPPQTSQGFHERREEILGLLATTFLCVAANMGDSEPEETRSWLAWCGHGFRALVLIADTCNQSLTRDAFVQWRSSESPAAGLQTTIWETLEATGINGEAIWFIMELLNIHEGS